MPSADNEPETTANNSFIEDVDFYYEGGLMILTGDFLLRRGFCCENGCRHCPYKDNEKLH